MREAQRNDATGWGGARLSAELSDPRFACRAQLAQRAGHAQRRWALRIRQRTTLARRNVVWATHWEGAQQSAEPAACQKARAKNRKPAKPHVQTADWAYDSERKACSSGRGAQRPGL